MKWDKNLFEKPWFAYTFAICSGVLLYIFVTHLGRIFQGIGILISFFYPVILGAVMAYVIDPFTCLFEKNVFKKVSGPTTRRILSVVVSLVALILFMVLLMAFLIPQIVDSMQMFVRNLDAYARTFQDTMDQLEKDLVNGDKILPFGLRDVNDVFDTINGLVDRLTAWVRDNSGSILNLTIDYSFDFISGFVTSFLAFILAIYFLCGKQGVLNNSKRFARAILSHKKYSLLAGFLKRCNVILVRYIAFDLIDGLIVGVVNAIFMSIMGMPYGVLVSVVVGVTNLAPTFGPIVGAIIGAFFLLIINPWYSLFFLIFTIILQTIDGYVIKPKLFGNQLGISSILVLVFLIVGGRILGVAGVLLAIPFAAIADFLYDEYFLVRLEKRREEQETVMAAAGVVLENNSDDPQTEQEDSASN